MAEKLIARIVEWNSEKGYGFLQVGPQRVFLHIKDFAERHKPPTAGDIIRFSMGKDNAGRTCAVEAVHQNDGGRLKSDHWFFVVLLMVTPVLALHRMEVDPRFGIVYVLAISTVAYLIYALDKIYAKAREWRIPESALHLIAFLGGWPGAFIAQQHLRHKCSKARFQVIFWIIVAIYQFVAIDFLLNWRLSKAAWLACQQLIHR